MEAGDVAVTARSGEWPTKAIKARKRVLCASAGADKQTAADRDESLIAKQPEAWRGLDPVGVCSPKPKVNATKTASTVR